MLIGIYGGALYIPGKVSRASAGSRLGKGRGRMHRCIWVGIGWGGGGYVEHIAEVVLMEPGMRAVAAQLRLVASVGDDVCHAHIRH